MVRAPTPISACSRRPAVRARARAAGRARRHERRGRAGRHDHAQRARAGRRRAGARRAVWAAGARAVGWGSSDAHRRAKELVLAGAPEALEAMRTSAEALPAAHPESRLDIVCRPVPDKHAQHKSKYTARPGIPGAFEGETVTRRRFMTGTAHGAGAIAAGCLRAARARLRHRTDLQKHAALTGKPSAPPSSSPTTTTSRWSSRSHRTSARPARATVYMRQHNAAIDTDPYDRNTPYIAISTPLRAPRLPGALGRRRGALHLPLPRRRLRPAGPPRGWPSGPAARPLLHARERRPRRSRRRASASTASCGASPRATRASRSTASASTSIPRARARRNCSRSVSPTTCQSSRTRRFPAPLKAPPPRPGEEQRQARADRGAPKGPASTSSTGSTSAPR